MIEHLNPGEGTDMVEKSGGGLPEVDHRVLLEEF
jgi:hypothetical protein